MRSSAVLFLFSTIAVGAQELVPNPSFEQVSNCPSFASQLDRAVPWFNPTLGTPELYHGCAPLSSYVSVPMNTTGGFQFARTGEGYIGLFTYRSELPNVREYAEVALLQPLEAGTCYRVTMHVNMPNDHVFAVDGFGAHFSVGPVTASDGYVLPLTPQVENPAGNLITDTLSWTEITGVFTAAGGETHLTIGNFKNDLETQVLQVNSGVWYQNTGYLLVDDVSVEALELSVDLGPDSLLCDGDALLLDAGNPGAQYLWSDGSTASTLAVATTGTYWVQVFAGACSASDTIVITAAERPAVELPEEVGLCAEATIELQARTNAAVVWMDGVTAATRRVSEPGIYTVVATNACGSATATSRVVPEICPCIPYLPNAFTPNDDGINDSIGPGFACGTGTVRWAVYDRWGRQVWEADGAERWDGRVAGSPAPTGVYNWYMEVHGSRNKDRYQGHVVLLR